MNISIQEALPAREDVKLYSTLTIGILAFQGAVREHARAVKDCGAQVREVRHPAGLTGLDGLIIPGGESTTIGKLMVEYGLIEPLKAAAAAGLPVFGTCAGLIILAKKITEGDQPLLELINIEARRNAFGRQTDSFETDINIPVLGDEPFRGIFIRAPWIESLKPGVKILAQLDVTSGHCGKIVLAEEGNILVSAFHPELTDDPRLHEYFLEKAFQGRELRAES